MKEILKDEEKSLEASIESAKRLLNEDTGPITSLKKLQPTVDTDQAFISHYKTSIQHTSFLGDSPYSDISYTGGTGFNKRHALVKALGEAIERYSLSIYDLDSFKNGEIADMKQQILNPLEMNKFSKKQRKKKDLGDERIKSQEYYWLSTTSLKTGEKKLVPAHLVYLPFPYELNIQSPMSTGAAAGTDYKSATKRAISEVIERECFIISYLNKLENPQIDLESIKDPEIRSIISRLKSENLKIKILDISLDHPFKVCLTIILNQNNGKTVKMGMDCSSSILESIKGSLEEASKDKGISGEFKGNKTEIKSIEDRSKYWSSKGNIEDLDFWIKEREEISVNELESNYSENDIERFLSYIRDRNYRCFIADITTDDVRRFGFKVVKAVIPEFHPLYLVEEFRYLGGERLYEVPVEEGFLEEEKSENEMNDVPHPFL
ncbi:MAG: YcaO-like family protein [Candidatus Paceibacteria bacterium]